MAYDRKMHASDRQSPKPVYVRSHVLRLPLAKGFLPHIALCKGSSLSTARGMDSVCCANCDNIRENYYNRNNYVVDTEDGIIYIERVIHMFPKLLEVISISRCKSKSIVYNPSSTRTSQSIYQSMLRTQCDLMKSLMLVDPGITSETIEDYIVIDLNGMPYIMPTADLRVVDSYGDDEGVTIKGNLLTLDDRDKMLESGKWSHVFLYYIIVDYLTGRKNTVTSW